MMIESNDFPGQILSLVRGKDFKLETAQIQAKALLGAITDEIPDYNWNYIPRRIVRNTSFATFALESIVTSDLELNVDLIEAARRLAMLWESLANLGEGISRETALLNAAVCYELAGYQANAACIAKKLLEDSKEGETSLTKMTGWFLQRSFVRLNNISKVVQIEPEIDNYEEFSLIETMIKAIIGKCFSQALSFFLRGDKQALNKAIEGFKVAHNMLATQGLVEESNLFRSLRSLLPVMRRRSTWTILPGFASNNPRWERYLKLLARGVGEDIYRGQSISELWPSQITALVEGGLLTSSCNKIFKMPTSAGKTRIAELAIVHTLVNEPGAKCIYVAPYRALVTELQMTFLNLFSDLGYRVSSITGTYESDEFEDLMFKEADVLVTTPEKLDLLLRAHPEFLENVRLFVLDESHIVHDRNRGIKFELLLTRLMRKLSNTRFIFISAVVPQETLEDFASWLKVSPNEDISTSKWRPSIQRYAKFEWKGQAGVIRYAAEEEIQKLHEFVPGVIRQRTFEYIKPETGRINHRKFPKPESKAETAAELALKFAELGPVLVFCSQTPSVRAVATALRNRVKLSLLSQEALPHFLQNTENTRSAILAEEWLGEDHFVTMSLKSGVAVHYGPLPDVVRTAIETDFRQRKYRVLVATNTLAQGVNLPIKTVIVHSVWRYLDQEGEQMMERISARDYWNIAGRAGRAGQETEGIIIHIQRTMDAEDYNYYLSKRENVEPVESALFQRLVDLLNERLSEEALKTEIDPEILALLVEEGTDTSLEGIAQNILKDSLVYVQATRNELPIERLNQAIVDTTKSIAHRVADAEHRAIYSSTGLSSDSCDRIRAHILENESDVRDFLLCGEIENLTGIINLLLPILLYLPEMQSTEEFSGGVNELLKKWIEGMEIRGLMNEFEDQATSLEDLGRFIDNLFRYLLPWGISGYIRIAAKLLDIDQTEFSDFTKFFSSMVKYGLPDSIACWAMSAGIPLRRIAIEIAAAYRDKVEEPNYQNFLEWLSTLSSDQLYHEFGLESPLLEEVSRSIFISSVNPLFQEFSTMNEFLPRKVKIRGIQYENRTVVALQANPGQQVNLVRDYDNLLDRNAIAVYLSGCMLGYVPHQVAQILAPEMDTGTNLQATVASVERERLPRVTIRIYTEEDK
jgi:helicase